jgi:tyrosine-protein phosphatase SIW14
VSSTTRWARTHAALLFLSLLAVPAAASPNSGDKRSAAEVNVSSVRIDNFGRVNANYYRGAQPKAGDYAALAGLGIKTLINLTSDDAMAEEEAEAQRVGLSYFQIPMTTHTSPTVAQIAQFLKIVTDPASQPVYVHCVGGRHRTGVMTAIYRMTQDRWSAVDAFNEMKQYKFGADYLHREFKEFVLAFRADALKAIAGASEEPHPAAAR